MAIKAKFRLTEKRKIIHGDSAPVYVFEATEDNDIVKLGKIKIRVGDERAKKVLREDDEFTVEITPVRKKPT